jgi:hypothetical protein
MSSCRLVRVFCKQETNQKVEEALRKELELKEKDIEEKDTKLNTLLQEPFGVIKLLATQYFNLRRIIEEPSNVRTRQLTEEQAAAAALAITLAINVASEINSSDTDSDSDSDLDAVKAASKKAEAAQEAAAKEKAAEYISAIEIFMLENYGINIAGCYKSILGISDIEDQSDIENKLKEFISCCYNSYVVGLDAEEDEYYTEISEDTIIFTSKYGTDTLTRKMMNPYYDAPYKKVIINGFINIGNGAFRDWYTNLEEVVIGDSVVNIGEEVFYACNGITKIVIGESLKTIGRFTFSYCYNISPVVISDETAKKLNPEWESPSPEGEPVSSFYGSSKPVEFILPEV